MHMPELITQSVAQYEIASLRAGAKSRSPLGDQGESSQGNRQTMPLFDTARMTRNLEAAYSEMWARQRLGGRPESFAIPGAS